ncbi:unnamed protein product [Vitrella brassicaformis CCMP3155]|uniref:Uncharacterized protein n=1 Tax=Vitrella brassicaformis (strain CCMP3155) TaxID=1169540 RepID=A0A0G4EDY5_VITBC|nr:unnamed protein product [Vitrella brassicaformis CCMP3155]|eukprot:CEL94190.1 unnamed protein product [Vitrella brassicaformis CCMP3155]
MPSAAEDNALGATAAVHQEAMDLNATQPEFLKPAIHDTLPYEWGEEGFGSGHFNPHAFLGSDYGHFHRSEYPFYHYRYKGTQGDCYRQGTVTLKNWKNTVEKRMLSSVFAGAQPNTGGAGMGQLYHSTHAARRFLKPHYCARPGSAPLTPFGPRVLADKSPAPRSTGQRIPLHGTFVDCDKGLKPSTPLIISHTSGEVKGRIDGDLHSRNTNPGYSRNVMGGFFAY